MRQRDCAGLLNKIDKVQECPALRGKLCKKSLIAAIMPGPKKFPLQYKTLN